MISKITKIGMIFHLIFRTTAKKQSEESNDTERGTPFFCKNTETKYCPTNCQE
jgi:hypothetical protein